MKILLTNFHYGRGGGHDTYVGVIARGLAVRHQVYVAAPATSRLYAHVSAMPGVHALPFEFPAKLKDVRRMVPAWRALRALLERERFDVVHVNGSPDHRLLMFAMMGMKGTRPRVVWTKHNSIAIKTDFLTRVRATRATDAVIAVSDSTATFVRDSVYGGKPVTVVKNGVDIDAFQPASAAETLAARAMLLGEAGAGQLVLGTVTGFDWYKGTMDMIAAVAALPREARDACTIVVVGTEPSEEQWREIDALGMREQVRVEGFVEDVKSYVRAFDVGFVVSYAIETVSFACREMMAMGKPVIVARYAGLPENIEDGVDGWIVPPHDPPALSGTLARILAQRGQLGAMSVRARAKAEREFSQQDFIDQTEQVYLQQLPTSSKSPPA
ncbi:glycosyltransferase family 4 protein [Paraburkholderia acidisoli]|uniref:Glycosyltransferase n=1 Tax=Paraburkholderia acidisoli TaxID=2571748 RepID=A0A7Z2GFS3_9BURK|nr:glycosyltransferase family 4 protein [Paraburkholderia acidisoli]QGZ60987.1 glycosyltransferase [Paraburkholderia acidisoli]